MRPTRRQRREDLTQRLNEMAGGRVIDLEEGRKRSKARRDRRRLGPMPPREAA
jgi:hypothetical protein